MKKLVVTLILCMTAALSGCATGPKHQEVKAAIPAIPKEMGRIYFYRTANMIGAAIQPSVMLNGEKVGDAVPGGFFFVDRPAGNHVVTVATEVDKKASFTLEPGQERFVKLTIGLGLIAGRIIPELVDKAQADQDIATLSYTGKPLK